MIGIVRNGMCRHADVKRASAPNMSEPKRHETTFHGSRTLPTSNFGNHSKAFIKLNTFSTITTEKKHPKRVETVREELLGVMKFQGHYFLTPGLGGNFLAAQTRSVLVRRRTTHTSFSKWYTAFGWVLRPIGGLQSPRGCRRGI